MPHVLPNVIKAPPPNNSHPFAGAHPTASPEILTPTRVEKKSGKRKKRKEKTPATYVKCRNMPYTKAPSPSIFNNCHYSLAWREILPPLQRQMEDPFPIPLFPILCFRSSQLSHAFADDIAGLEYASPFFVLVFGV